MLKQSIYVQDQYGIKHTIEATFDRQYAQTKCNSYLKHITINGEDIRPSFDMCFHSQRSEQVFRII